MPIIPNRTTEQKYRTEIPNIIIPNIRCGVVMARMQNMPKTVVVIQHGGRYAWATQGFGLVLVSAANYPRSSCVA